MWNQIKTVLLLGILSGLVLGVGFLFGGNNGLIIALVLAVLMNFGMYFWSHKLVLAMYRARPATKKEYPPGIIGPLSLQSIVTVDMDIVVYDVSLRVPGNPIMATTSPYTKYYYGKTFGVGRRIAMEIKNAYMEERLADIVT